MFTIKQTDALGNVRLKQCDDLTIRNEHGMIWVRAFDTQGKEIAFWSGWPSDDRNEDILYVMNGNGATVSMHRFRPSAATSLSAGDGETCQAGASQLTPESLAA